MATIFDTRFEPHYQSDGSVTCDHPRPRREKSVEALYEAWKGDLLVAQSAAGKRLSRDELRQIST